MEFVFGFLFIGLVFLLIVFFLLFYNIYKLWSEVYSLIDDIDHLQYLIRGIDD